MNNIGTFIGVGTLRISYDLGNGYIIKFPISRLGEIANKNEAYYYKKNSDIVATTFLLKNGALVQEKIHDYQVFPYKEATSKNFIDKLLNIYGDKALKFNNKIQNHKFNIGFDNENNLKTFDYEDTKFYLGFYIDKGYSINFSLIPSDYIYYDEYLNEIGINNTCKIYFEDWFKIKYPEIYKNRPVL